MSWVSSGLLTFTINNFVGKEMVCSDEPKLVKIGEKGVEMDNQRSKCVKTRCVDVSEMAGLTCIGGLLRTM